MKAKKKKENDVQNFFDTGFEQGTDWTNITKLDLPVTLKYLDHEDFESRFGKTVRYIFEDSNGHEVRLLCKGKTFQEAIERFVPISTEIELSKNMKGYWVFRFAS